MNLFENDLVLFPMHIDLSHWVLAVADFRSKTITSYDRWCLFTLHMKYDHVLHLQYGQHPSSLSRSNQGIFGLGAQGNQGFKSKGILDVSGWRLPPAGLSPPLIHHEQFPNLKEQENTADCGVFLCRIAESLTRGGGSGTFTQADMPYLR